MSGSILGFARTAHRNSQELLPWYVAGTLDEDQHSGVESHLRECAQCREDLRFEEEARTLVRSVDVAANPEASFASMRSRLEEPYGLDERLILPARGALRELLDRARPWFGPALVAQSCVLLFLGWNLAMRDPAATEYRLLSAVGTGSARQADLVVVFDPRAREQEVRRILRNARARIVGGPTATDAYLLWVDPAFASEALERLRSEEGVRRAQSLAPVPAPASERMDAR